MSISTILKTASSCLALALFASTAAFAQTPTLTARQSGPGDFGRNVALQGDTLAVSRSGLPSSFDGIIRIHLRNQGGTDNWGQVKEIIPSFSDTRYYGWELALDGDILVTAAPWAGQVFIYNRNLGGTENWGLEKTFALIGGAGGGYGLAVSGDTLVLRQSNQYNANLPVLDIYERNRGGTNNWGLSTSKALTTVGFLGDTACFSGDLLVVGDPGGVVSGIQAGNIKMYKRNEGGPDMWGEVHTIDNPDPEGADGFGSVVRITADSNTLLVAAPLDKALGTNAGAAYIFDRDQGGPDNWGLVKKLLPADGGYDHRFSGDRGNHNVNSIAISGDIASVCSHRHNKGAYLFARNEGGTNNWGQVLQMTSTSGKFEATAIEGNTLILGEPNQSATGYFNVYDLGLATPNTAPSADAGADYGLTVPVSQTVLLDGSGSSDPDSDPITYAWTLVVPGGSQTTLTGPLTESPSFVPDTDGDYVATLVVTDDSSEASAPDSITISVVVDDPPTADAGANQLALTGNLVQLDGSLLSTDDVTPVMSLAYSWTLTGPAGSTAALSGASTATPDFVPDLAGVYSVELTVTDGAGQASNPDQVVITAAVPNAQPTADAGSDNTGATNVTVQFNGVGSSDPDADALTFAWVLANAPVGSMAGLIAGTTATPSLTPDLPGTYVVQLVVNDGELDSAVDSVEFEAVDGKIFVELKLSEVSAYVNSLSLDNFYKGDHSRPRSQRHQDRHAKKAKRHMLRLLRHAACDIRRFGHEARHHHHHSAAHFERHKQHTLKSINHAIEHSDGVALRSLADVKHSGFRRDYIIGATSSVIVYDCLIKAAEAVAAIQ